MSSMQTYRVQPGYEVRLGPGITFQAAPEDVAGALRAGAIEPVKAAQAEKSAPQPQAEPAQSEKSGQKSKEGA